MTNPNLTQLAVLVDRSGSMASIASDAEGGVRALIAEQRALPGKLWVDLFQFDDEFERVEDVDGWHLSPRGTTALLDAVGKSITLIGEKLDKLTEDERPGKVIFQIATDGLENSSQDWDLDRVRVLISNQTNVYGWEFFYSGANQDSFSAARNLHIPVANASNYAPTAAGVAQAYSSVSGLITRSRTGV